MEQVLQFMAENWELIAEVSGGVVTAIIGVFVLAKNPKGAEIAGKIGSAIITLGGLLAKSKKEGKKKEK